MLRIPAARASSRLRTVSTVRLLSSSSLRSNVNNIPPTSAPKQTPADAKPLTDPTPATPSTPSLSTSAAGAPAATAAPKKSRFRRFVYTTAFLTAVLYGSGVWFALNNDSFHDMFSEYVPFAETVIVFIEEVQFQRRFPSVARKAVEGDDKRVTIHRGGATWRLAGSEGSVPYVSAKSASSSSTTDAPAAPVKPAQIEAAKPLVVLPKLPKFAFDGTVDPSIESVVKSINSLFAAISTKGTVDDSDLATLAASMGEVSTRFLAVKEEYEQELKKTIETQMTLLVEQAAKSQEEFQKAVLELEGKWKEAYYAERDRLATTYASRLKTELDSLEAVYNSKVKNEVLAIDAQKDAEFAKQVAEKVETERNGRLAKLAEVKKSYEETIVLSKEVDQLLDTAERTAELQLALGSLVNALAAPYAVPLAPLLARIKIAAGDDPLVSSVINAFPRSAYAGVLSPQQLAARFKQIAPEIRKASLVPENAGVAGFAGSWILSKLLWKKEGKPTGADVESVLARAESALLEGHVEQAVREVNMLDGWRKKLADDWLEEGRKRSEVEFLAQVLSEEGKVWQYRV
ncbi:mitochondrial inner membrane protein-domain-containing protein [Lipomyces oligophaga]|uniref:mitochondrial inner membrane protein-domain-containing protein n=1 Tax=Lipomyces oligophaga TaxID=45792 RepID=UPI0034CFEC60